MRVSALVILALAAAVWGQSQFPWPQTLPLPFPPIKIPSTAPPERLTASIEGRVTAEERGPLPNTRVYLQKGTKTGPLSTGNNDSGVPMTLTSSDGSFIFAGIAAGSYALTVSHFGYNPNFEVVKVKADQHVENVMIHLTILDSLRGRP